MLSRGDIAAKRLNTILVATDRSPTSEHAIRRAVELASEHQAKVLFVHVIPTLDLSAAAGDHVGSAGPREPTEQDHVLVNDAAAFARERGVAAESTLLVGSTAAEILAYAELHDVNMIVVGARRHGSIPSAPLGTVSLAVLRASTRPLLIVDGQKSVTYCGNGSCPDVRLLEHSETDEESSPVQSQGPEVAGSRRVRHMTNVRRAQTAVTSGVPVPLADSADPGLGRDVAPGTANVSARSNPERVAGASPVLSGLLPGAVRLENVVLVQDGAWAITATIPYDGVIIIAQFTTRVSASAWYATAERLAAS